MEVLAVFFFCFLFFFPSFPFCIREHTGSVLLLGGKGITLLLWAGQWQLCGLKAKEREKKKKQCEAPAVASLLPKCSRCFVFLFLCTVMIHYVPSLLCSKGLAAGKAGGDKIEWRYCYIYWLYMSWTLYMRGNRQMLCVLKVNVSTVFPDGGNICGYKPFVSCDLAEFAEGGQIWKVRWCDQVLNFIF